MNVPERILPISMKIAHAREHLHSLKKDVGLYLESNPCAIGLRRDPESRRLVYFVDHIGATPLRFSLLLGDVLQNLRSALDHLAFQLVWVGSGKLPSNHVYFPIADNRSKYVEQRRWQLKGAAPQAIAQVDALSPYRDGNELLWKLHRLSIVDKHRVLITAGSAFRSVNIGPMMMRDLAKAMVEAPAGASPAALPSLNLYLRPADRMFPLKKGDELFIDAPDAEPSQGVTFHFDVAFGEEGIAAGEPIVETLESMVALVESIVPEFGQYFA